MKVIVWKRDKEITLKKDDVGLGYGKEFKQYFKINRKLWMVFK